MAVEETKVIVEQTMAGLMGAIPVSVIAIGFFWRNVNSFAKFKDDVTKAISALDKSQALAAKDQEHAAKVIDLVSRHAEQIAKMQADLNVYYERLRKLEGANGKS